MNTCTRCGEPVPGLDEPTNDVFHTWGGLCCACHLKEPERPPPPEPRQVTLTESHINAQWREVQFRSGQVSLAVQALEKAVKAVTHPPGVPETLDPR